MDQYFVKSFEIDFKLKTLKGKDKVSAQSIQDITKSNIIKPNTKSFGRSKRLACTLLGKNYTKTYRSQGLIFTTQETPDHIYPFDIAVLTKNNHIIVNYYRIENNLHVYYNHGLIEGFEQFLFNDLKSMLKAIPSPEAALARVNDFRTKNGYKPLEESKKKLLRYNEIVFERPIVIEPIALYGYRKEAREMAKKLGLPHFRSAKVFYESLN